MNNEDDFIEKHPSFGMVGFSRRQGAAKCFGSHLKTQHTTIALTIKRAERKHHLASDWYHANEELIEVVLSPAQFADLLTNMNQGDGVPCTIRYVRGEGYMPDVPSNDKTEIERVQDGFAGKMDKLRKELESYGKAAKEILDKKTLNKEDRAVLLSLVNKPARFLWDHAPFVMEQFVESTEKVVTHAKAEVEAAFTSIVRTAGLEKLVEQGMLSKPELPALGPIQDAEIITK